MRCTTALVNTKGVQLYSGRTADASCLLVRPADVNQVYTAHRSGHSLECEWQVNSLRTTIGIRGHRRRHRRHRRSWSEKGCPTALGHRRDADVSRGRPIQGGSHATRCCH